MHEQRARDLERQMGEKQATYDAQEAEMGELKARLAEAEVLVGGAPPILAPAVLNTCGLRGACGCEVG